MAQVAEIKFGQKVMEKETEKKISEIEGVCASVRPVSVDPKKSSHISYFHEINWSSRFTADIINTNSMFKSHHTAEGRTGL